MSSEGFNDEKIQIIRKGIKIVNINFDECLNTCIFTLISILKSVWPQTFEKDEFLLIYFGFFLTG